MTAALTIPAAVWEHRVDGVPFVAAIVEGEPSHQYWPQGHPNHIPTQPPAWLIALRDARCETCEGHGYRVHPEDGSSEPCDGGCHDGRLLHDVRVETGVINNRIGPNFGRSQTRTVRCLVDFAPVTAVRGACLTHEGPHLLSEYDSVFWCAGPDAGSHISELTPTHVDALGGIDKFVPGKSFALVATVVER